VEFALRGLAKCWLPERSCFSRAYRLEGRCRGNQSIPSSDYFYTLNVLLGFARLADKGAGLSYDRQSVFLNACARLTELPVPVYAYGMAAWAGAELGFELPAVTGAKISELLASDQARMRWSAQDLGMMTSGCLAQSRQGGGLWKRRAVELKSFIDKNLWDPNARLFFNSASGMRRRFASFATAVYASLASFQYGELYGDERAIVQGSQCVTKLLECQGPMGEWPWFYDVRTGKVVDNYPVFSVHQDGMAPAVLRHAVAHGNSDAPAALVHGFKWIFGNNSLGVSMVVPEDHLIIRAIARRQPWERQLRAFRAITNGVLGRSDRLVRPEDLALVSECRSYHLGWILWSFAGRRDFEELTHNLSWRV